MRISDWSSDVCSSDLLALGQEDRTLPTMKISAVLLLIVMVLLVQQPDIGQTVLFAAVWLAQAVLAGLSIQAVIGLGALGITALGTAYLLIPHVTSRIDQIGRAHVRPPVTNAHLGYHILFETKKK